MEKMYWYFVCEMDFVVMNQVMLMGGVHLFVLLYLDIMMLWMAKKFFEEFKKDWRK